jgi:hypothetical protein
MSCSSCCTWTKIFIYLCPRSCRIFFLRLSQRIKHLDNMQASTKPRQTLEVVKRIRGATDGVWYAVLRDHDGRLFLAKPIEREVREAAATLATLGKRKTMALSNATLDQGSGKKAAAAPKNKPPPSRRAGK